MVNLNIDRIGENIVKANNRIAKDDKEVKVLETNILAYCTRPRTSSEILQLFAGRVNINIWKILHNLVKEGMLNSVTNKYVTDIRYREIQPVMSINAGKRKAYFEDLNEDAKERVVKNVKMYLKEKGECSSDECADDFINRNNDNDSINLMLQNKVNKVEASEKKGALEPEYELREVTYYEGEKEPLEEFLGAMYLDGVKQSLDFLSLEKLEEIEDMDINDIMEIDNPNPAPSSKASILSIIRIADKVDMGRGKKAEDTKSKKPTIDVEELITSWKEGIPLLTIHDNLHESDPEGAEEVFKLMLERVDEEFRVLQGLKKEE